MLGIPSRRSPMTPYSRPGFATRAILNPLMRAAVRLGFSPRGARVLVVRGRTSGAPREVPVNPLTVDGVRYLVAPRGDTQWVRNLRAAGEGHLRLGRRDELIRVTELPDADKPPLLREYLRRWRPETGKYFAVGADPTDDELRAVAGRHPVFRLT